MTDSKSLDQKNVKIPQGRWLRGMIKNKKIFLTSQGDKHTLRIMFLGHDEDIDLGVSKEIYDSETVGTEFICEFDISKWTDPKTGRERIFYNHLDKAA